jgi:hypothetical protein
MHDLKLIIGSFVLSKFISTINNGLNLQRESQAWSIKRLVLWELQQFSDEILLKEASLQQLKLAGRRLVENKQVCVVLFA